MEAKRKITFSLILFFICCYFMRLGNFPNEITVIGGAALCLVLLIQQRRFRIDIGICLLALTMITHYVIADGVIGILYSIVYIPSIIYFLGIYSVFQCSDMKKNEERLFLLILVMVAGYTVLGTLNSYMYFAGYVVPGTRRWQDFWSHAIVPGTQHTAYFLPALVMFFPSVMYFKERKILNVIFIILTFFFCYTSLATRSRMPILIFVIVCFGQLLLYIILEWKKVKKIVLSKTTWMLIVCGIVVLSIGFLLVKDTELVTAFINNLNKGGGIFNNVRFKAQKMALLQLFDFPMGGKQMDLGKMELCHNAWLDIANISGLIPFFLLVMYTIYTAFETIRLVLDKSISTKIKIIISALYLSFFLYMTVEPALTASVHLVAPWIWVNALTHGYISLKRISE